MGCILEHRCCLKNRQIFSPVSAFLVELRRQNLTGLAQKSRVANGAAEIPQTFRLRSPPRQAVGSTRLASGNVRVSAVGFRCSCLASGANLLLVPLCLHKGSAPVAVARSLSEPATACLVGRRAARARTLSRYNVLSAPASAIRTATCRRHITGESPPGSNRRMDGMGRRALAQLHDTCSPLKIMHTRRARNLKFKNTLRCGCKLQNRDRFIASQSVEQPTRLPLLELSCQCYYRHCRASAIEAAIQK